MYVYCTINYFHVKRHEKADYILSLELVIFPIILNED